MGQAMGYLLMGTGGGIAAGIAVLATSGSILVAFLTYMLGGAVLTLAAALMSLACAPIRQRLGLAIPVREQPQRP
jgi:hypothetical protein